MPRHDDDLQYEEMHDDATHLDPSQQDPSAYLPSHMPHQRAYQLPEQEETKSLDIPPPRPRYELSDEETLGLDPSTRSLGYSLGLTDEDDKTVGADMMLADAWARPPQRHETHAYGDSRGQEAAEEPAISTFKDSRQQAQIEQEASSAALAVQMRGDDVGLGGGFRFALGLILVVLAVAIGILSYMIFHELQKQPLPPTRPRVDPALQKQQEQQADEAMYQRRYMLAVGAAKQGRWEIALRSFTVVAQQSQEPQRKRRAQALQAYLERELAAQSTLKAASSDFRTRQYQEALQKLANIPKDTRVSRKAQRLRSQIRKIAFKKTFKTLRKLRKRKRFSKAKKLLAYAVKVDPEYTPTRREHTQLARAMKRPYKKCQKTCVRKNRGKRRQKRKERCLDRCKNYYILAPLPSRTRPDHLAGMALFGKELLANPEKNIPETPLPNVPTARPLPAAPSNTAPQPPRPSTTSLPQDEPKTCTQTCSSSRGRRAKRRCKTRCLKKCKRSCHYSHRKILRRCLRKCRRNRRCKRSCQRTFKKERRTCQRACR
ncbi:MAG: hypothetical protein H6727_09430 [Myxococcales bacterium]|nr:hypothetical protein [Myxococcales bacterium]